MGDKTGINWTDSTWNPVRGCSRVSEGCRNCYAETMAARFCGPGLPYEGLAKRTPAGPRWTGKVRMVLEHLADPLRWQKPRRIFTNSMSDLFHEGFTDDEIAAVFGVMAAAPRHTFQVLTKRPARMREWFEAMGDDVTRSLRRCGDAAEAHGAMVYAVGKAGRSAWNDSLCRWPLSNVWLGATVENQATADGRIPDLLATPAAVRFLSCEPLLGPVVIGRENVAPFHETDAMLRRTPRIDWLIAGCESGPGARDCDPEWLRALRDECDRTTAFWLKQAKPGPGIEGEVPKGSGVIDAPTLDGRQWLEMPQQTDAARSPSR